MELLAMLELAIELAVKAHQGQKDKKGDAYILHPLRVMMSMETNEEKIVAILHDVIEDTSITESDLKNYGFSEAVIQGILCLTKKSGESYEDFILRVKKNSLAKRVKIMDIKDNMDITRLCYLNEVDIERLTLKYAKALKILLS